MNLPATAKSAVIQQFALKNVNNCLNTKIYSYLETSGCQSSNLFLNVHFSTPVLIRHLLHLNTMVFLHWCLICGLSITLVALDIFGNPTQIE